MTWPVDHLSAFEPIEPWIQRAAEGVERLDGAAAGALSDDELIEWQEYGYTLRAALLCSELDGSWSGERRRVVETAVVALEVALSGYARAHTESDGLALLTECEADSLLGWTELRKMSLEQAASPEVWASLSAQASSPLRDVRLAGFEAATAAYEKAAPLAAKALRHVVSSRLRRWEYSGHCTPAERATAGSGVDSDTVVALMTAIEAGLPRFRSALADVLSPEHWIDQFGQPFQLQCDESLLLAMLENIDMPTSYRQEGKRVLEQARLDTRHTVGWGPVSLPLPALRTTRLWVPHTQTFRFPLSVAHELGHSWHASLIWRRPPSERSVPLVLGELASMLAEVKALSCLADMGVLPIAQRRQEAAALTAALLFNVYSRYVFEQRLYAQGTPLDAPGLVALQQEVLTSIYGARFANPDGYLWIRKPHLFGRRPFDNWPYLLGFLLSSWLARQDSELVEALVERSGALSVEALFESTASVALQDPAFWKATLDGVYESTFP